MKRKLYLLVTCLGLLCAPAAMAQKKAKKVVKVEVSARVVDEEGNALAGVMVTANEGSDRAVTDADGNVSLKLKEGSVLSFDYAGYQSETMKDAALNAAAGVVVLSENDLRGVYSEVSLPYQTKQQYKTSGAVTYVDAAEHLEFDNRTNIGSAVAGKVAGLTGLNNMHGLGSGAITVVDGIIRDIDYLTLQEVESITVLKDAVSRALYGAEGDKGVVLIKTKRGEANKQNINFDVEAGLQTAISYPNYLGAVDYMTAYNQASMNDYGYNKYTSEIENTLNRVDPVLYPDNDYYSDQWVKSVTNYSSVYGEASGGNESVRYFMNMGWKHNEGWIKAGEKDNTDVLNLRGKIDFEVTKWLKMHTDASAVFDMNSTPNMDLNLTDTKKEDFWSKSTTFLPISAPLLIPTDRVSNLDALTGVSTVQGKYLLGGTSVYQDNLLGNAERLGSISTMNRWMQFKVGFDMDLSGITKGLTATGSANYEFNNIYVESVNNTYSVYEITGIDSNNMFTVAQHGVDSNTTAKSVNHQSMDFARQLSGYVALNYARTFGKHDISALAMGYGRQDRFKDTVQEDRRLSTGLQASYMYDDKYLVEAAVVNQASRKMDPSKRWSASPSFGAAWVLSNEEFMQNNSVVDYFKLRTSYGTIENDNWGTYGNYQGYFLYQPIYQSSTIFNYGDATYKNNSLLISSIGNTYGWQKRNEFTVGFDSYLFDKSLWVEASYFNSTTEDMLVLLDNQTPATMGGSKLYGNYNSIANRGFEIGASYTRSFGDLRATIGANYMYMDSEILKYEEPTYSTKETMHLTRLGASNSAMFALEADGLYTAEDFDASGELISGPKPSFGAVQAGDIKYVDYNKDGIINENDVHDTGFLSGNNHVGNLHLELNYKNWSLFALGSFGFGGKGYKNSSYYWFKGTEAKYSEFAKEAFDATTNPDPNAECPRLTLGQGSNNYRNSTFWMYDRSQVKLDALQLGYTFNTNGDVIKNLKVYLRASNLFTLGSDAEILQLNVGGTPQSRLFSLGLVTSF